MVQRYSHLDPAHLTEAVERMVTTPAGTAGVKLGRNLDPAYVRQPVYRNSLMRL